MYRLVWPRNRIYLIGIVHSPISQIQKCWHETDHYFGSPSGSEGLRGLEIDNNASGFGFLGKYWDPNMGDPHSSVLGRHHSNISLKFIKGT